MRLTFRLNAGEHERFTDEAARSLIGQRPRFTRREYDDAVLEDVGHAVLEDLGHAVVTDAKVIDDGRAMLITYEPEGDLGPLFGRSRGGYSLGPAEP